MDSGVGDGVMNSGSCETGKADKAFKIYSALKYLPVALYLLFIVASFVFLALPIASYNSSEYSGIPVDASGSGYTALFKLLNFDVHIYNSVVAFYIFIIIGTGYSFYAIITCIKKKFGKRKLDSFVGASFAGNVDSGFIIIYIVLSVLSLVIIGRIVAVDEGYGVFSVGAYPIAVPVTAAAFTVISIIGMIIRYRIELRRPDVKMLEQETLK